MQQQLNQEAVKRHQDLATTESTPSLLRAFQGHKDRVTQVIFNPNLRQLISCSTDGMIMTWSL
jgi:WD40 repeat protein